MATNKLISKPKNTQAYAPSKQSKATKPAISKISSGKGKAAKASSLPTETIAEQELLELNRIALQINQQLETMHEDMQDIIRDMRAMRGAGSA